MQLHTRHAGRSLDGSLAVSLTGITCRAAIDLGKDGDVRLVIESPEEGEQLIRAIAGGVNLMLGARTLLAPAPAGRWCGATYEPVPGVTVHCDRGPHGSDVRHAAPGQREGDPDITWTDEHAGVPS